MAGSRRRTLGIIVGVAVLVVAAAGFAGWWFLIRDDAPPEADIDTAGQTLDEEASGDTSGDAASGVDGNWTVDTSVGSFERGHRRRRRGRSHDPPERQRQPRRCAAVTRTRVRHVPHRHLLADRAAGAAVRR